MLFGVDCWQINIILFTVDSRSATKIGSDFDLLLFVSQSAKIFLFSVLKSYHMDHTFFLLFLLVFFLLVKNFFELTFDSLKIDKFILLWTGNKWVILWHFWWSTYGMTNIQHFLDVFSLVEPGSIKILKFYFWYIFAYIKCLEIILFLILISRYTSKNC